MSGYIVGTHHLVKSVWIVGIHHLVKRFFKISFDFSSTIMNEVACL